MKFLLITALVAFTAAFSSEDQDLILEADTKGKVFIIARRIKPLRKGSPGKIRFAILGYGQELEVAKASFGRRDRKAVDDDLKASYKIYSKEEIEKFFEDKDRKPRRLPDSAIIGVAENGEATCDQHAQYGISYDDKHRTVFVRVLGCGKHARSAAAEFLEAKSDVSIKIRKLIPVRQKTPIEVKFAIFSYKVDLDVAEVSFERIDEKLVKDDLKAELKLLSQEEIKKIAEEKGIEIEKLPRSVILGKAKKSAATCEQNTRYILGYGDDRRVVKVSVFGCRH